MNGEVPTWRPRAQPSPRSSTSSTSWPLCRGSGLCGEPSGQPRTDGSKALRATKRFSALASASRPGRLSIASFMSMARDGSCTVPRVGWAPSTSERPAAKSSRSRTLPSSEPLTESMLSHEKVRQWMGPKCPPPLWPLGSSAPYTWYSVRQLSAVPRRSGSGSNWSSVPAPTSATSRASWPPPTRQSHCGRSSPALAAVKSCWQMLGRSAMALRGRSQRQLCRSRGFPRAKPALRSHIRTCMSVRPQLAMMVLSWEKATIEVGPSWASSRVSSAPVPACQKRTSPPACTEQMHWESGPAHATCVALDGSVGSSMVSRDCGAAPFTHSGANSSSVTAAGRFLKLLQQAMALRNPEPSMGPHSTKRPTPGSCNSQSCCAVATSHMSTMLSAPQESMRAPSGLTEQAHTAPRWPSKVFMYSPLGMVHARTSLSLPQVKRT
mmetsp:Transcript_15472/g.46437  ORF Transcript_15472/g.46437 Transcript_15472/m.46437 type:complete len:437 (-) Transcript_15472:1044-2354(-)